MRNGLTVLWLLVCSIASAAAQVSVGIGFPGVNIGINFPVYPELVAVPGYPVYYAPQVNSNYFFYDGLYWVYRRDNWYASSWYNGPWALVAPEAVPLFILRVPVRYYRQPPVYFRGWRSDAPPRWGEHWGNSWDQRRRGWDTWNRSSVPVPAPLPVYQRQYSGSRYPRVEQQQVLQSQNYRYQPRETVVQQQYQTQRMQSVPAPSPQQRPRAEPQRVQSVPVPSSQQRPGATQERFSVPQDSRGSNRPSSLQQGAPRGQPPQMGGGDGQRPAAARMPPQQSAPNAQHPRPQPQQAAVPREPQGTRSQGQDKGPQGKGPPQEHGQDKGRGKGEQHDGERNK